jgi:hypothetical protein
VQDRDTTAVEVTSKDVHYPGANSKGGTPLVATLAVQSVAVTVAVDPLGALIEGKPSAVVFVSCRQASSAGTFHALR